MGFLSRAKTKVALSRQAEAALYAHVMEELEAGARDKGIWGKALAQSNGDKGKAESLYLKLRVEALVDMGHIAGEVVTALDELDQETEASKPKREDELEELGCGLTLVIVGLPFLFVAIVYLVLSGKFS